MLLYFFLIVIGIVCLSLGANLLVRGSSSLAETLGVPPLVIGLTVVAYGTSSPELFISTINSFSGQTTIALGNLVGSNIFNVFLILGLSASLTTLAVHLRIIIREVPALILLSGLAYLFCLDGILSVLEGLVLVTILIAHVYWMILGVRGYEETDSTVHYEPSFPKAASRLPRGGPWDIGMIIAGLVLLVVGSEVFSTGAIAIARKTGLSESVIAMTLVAAGTSIPELATSVLASLRGELDIAVGNVIGSNFFNLTGILGLSVLVSPGQFNVPPSVVAFDIPLMVLGAVICLPIFFSEHRISRWEGILFLVYFIVYLTSILMPYSHWLLEPDTGNAIFLFGLPLTLVTALIGLYRYAYSDRSRAGAP